MEFVAHKCTSHSTNDDTSHNTYIRTYVHMLCVYVCARALI